MHLFERETMAAFDFAVVVPIERGRDGVQRQRCSDAPFLGNEMLEPGWI